MQVSLPLSPRYSQSPRIKPLSCSPVINKGPITPDEALLNYSSLLMPYETTEIEQFKEIYFLGYPNSKNKTIQDYSNIHKFNFKDHICYRYEIVSNLGNGSFGRVFNVFDHKTKRHVAVKIFLNKNEIINQSEIEADILALMNKHRCQYTVKGIDYFYFRSHPCISFELLGMNLYVMHAKDNFRPYKHSIVRDYAYQIFRGLFECSNLGIVHCDIKPENICTTISDTRRIKIVDFGSSFQSLSGRQNRFYIQSRFYRSPEVILRSKYGAKIDVWSAAVIIIELLIGRHVFPGRNELEMLNLMEDLIGPMPRSMANNCRKKKPSFFNANGTLKSFCSIDSKKEKRSSIKCLLGNEAPPQLIDFLERCLTWKPSLRMSTFQALQHPWLNQKAANMKSNDTESLPSLMKYL